MRHKLLKILALFFTVYVSAQNIDVSGNVQDNTGFPIPGVNVIVKNTSKGAVTDFDGNFTLTNVETGATLTFSYIGYVTKEVVVSNRTKLTVVLEEDVAKLDEVVVVGYGTQRKKEVTGIKMLRLVIGLLFGLKNLSNNIFQLIQVAFVHISGFELVLFPFYNLYSLILKNL